MKKGGEERAFFALSAVERVKISLGKQKEEARGFRSAGVRGCSEKWADLQHKMKLGKAGKTAMRHWKEIRGTENVYKIKNVYPAYDS